MAVRGFGPRKGFQCCLEERACSASLIHASAVRSLRRRLRIREIILFTQSVRQTLAQVCSTFPLRCGPTFKTFFFPFFSSNESESPFVSSRSQISLVERWGCCTSISSIARRTSLPPRGG